MTPIHRGTLDIQMAKEAASKAFVSCVAAAAGCELMRMEPDTQGVDLVLTHRREDPPGLKQLDLQLKASAMDVSGDSFSFKLEALHYNRLCEDENVRANAYLLVVYLLPASQDEWIEHNDMDSVLRRSAFWASLRGKPKTDQATKTVSIPMVNQFTVASVCDIFDGLHRGIWP